MKKKNLTDRKNTTQESIMPISCPAGNRLNTRRCSLGRILVEPQDEAMRIFDKYHTGMARRLKKAEALQMLEAEFGLSESEAKTMFQAFDKDDNEVMSLWEFRQFYHTIGYSAHFMISLFKKLEVEGSGLVDIGQAFDALKEVDCGSKGKLTEEEVEKFLKSAAGEEKEIDLKKFLNLMCIIKRHKGASWK